MEQIDFSYNTEPFIVNLDFKVSEAEMVGLLGPNGSGKSTILKLASGILKPISGKVLLWGKKISEYKGRDRAKLISYLPQVLDISVPFKVKELVKMGLYPYDIPPSISVSDVLNLVGLEQLADLPVSEISGGERRRAFIAMTLLQGAGLILLDEPLANLDVKYQLELIRLLKELKHKNNISLVMALHDINLIHHFDRVYVVKNGSIVASGIPSEVVTEELLREVFEVDIKLYQLDNGTLLFGL